MKGMLNLTALRGNRLPQLYCGQLTLDQVTEAPGSFCISRRQMLKLAGVAAVATAVGAKTFERTFMGPFELVEGRQRAAFCLGGEEKWVIDTKVFSGNPQLEVEKNKDYIRLILRGAKYPGTDIPADMICELSPGLLGWKVSLRMFHGSFLAAGAFEKWLQGEESLRSAVSFSIDVCRLVGGYGVTFTGPGTAEFFPDWTVRLKGKGFARLAVPNGRLISDDVQLGLLKAGEPSLFLAEIAKRTLITLNRGGRDWLLQPQLKAKSGWKIAAEENAFDSVAVETGMSRSGRAYRALVAQSLNLDRGIVVQPAANLTGHGEKPFSLPLRGSRYVAAYEGCDCQEAIFADFSDEPVWLHTGEYSLLLGKAPGTRPFEAVGHNCRLTRGNCSPALLGMAAALGEGVITETAGFPEGSTMTLFSTGKYSRSLAASVPKFKNSVTNVGQVSTGSSALSVVLPSHFTVSVLRPEDFLSLTFEFINLKLAGGNLVKAEQGKTSYIIVHFPPQSIAEQAFFEAASEFGDGGSETPQTPARALISGPSRLAFIVQDSTAPIPYNIQALLDWSKLQPSVAMTAKPPDSGWVAAEISVLEFGSQKVPNWVSQVTREKLAAEYRMPVQVTTGPQPVPRPASGFPAVSVPASREFRVSAVTSSPIKSPVIKKPVVPLPSVPESPVVPGTQKDISPPVIKAESVLGRIETDFITEPAPFHTAIEMPWRLFISPHSGSAWTHSPAPVNHNLPDEPYELWHTRLAVKDHQGSINEYNSMARTLRAIWSPDYTAPPSGTVIADVPVSKEPPTPFRMSLDARDRHEIVRLSADFHISGYKALPIQADRLMLTALGAWMDARGAWDPPNNTELMVEAWQHRATMGRDHYVKVVSRGYLFPFGHRASLIKVTERKFQKAGFNKPRTAFLRQRMYIVIREPEKFYPKTDDRRGRQLPFRRVLVKTAATPALNNPALSQVNGKGRDIFWPRVGSGDFKFHLAAEDWEGRCCEFLAPMIFVAKEYATLKERLSDLKGIKTEYDKAANESRRKCGLAGQKVAYAESSRQEDTAFETTSITFGVEVPENLDAPSGQPRYFPTMAAAEVRLPAVAQLTGNDAGTTVIELAQDFLEYGFKTANNVGQVYAKVKGTANRIEFGAEKVGGLIRPVMQISGLSRSLGPVAGNIGSFFVGTPNSVPGEIADIFDDSAKILGGIRIKDILEKLQVGSLVSDSLPRVPNLNTGFEYEDIPVPGGKPVKVPVAVLCTYKWEPRVADWGPFKTLSTGEKKTKLAVEAKLRKNLKVLNEGPTYSVNSKLNHFIIDLEVIIVEFKSLSFSSKTGEAYKVDADIARVEFGGPLTFVNELKNYMRSGGAGPYLDIQPSGMETGFSLGIPNITIGLFSIKNISLATKLTIPFTDNPISLRFDFCRKDAPFLLTVGTWGGSGYLGIELVPGGLKSLEAAFEFGATMSLSIGGLASGSVSVMGGIYFKIVKENGSDKTELEGYIRMRGALKVLGLVTVTVEFFLGLKWMGKENGVTRLRGRATLTVSIEILFFSTSVSLSVEREIAGGDPKFTEVMEKSHWDTYCEAFA